MDVASKIKTLREEKNLTQEDLGRLCGTTKQTIFKYENGIVTNIPISRIEQIANVLGVSPVYLLGWEITSPMGNFMASRMRELRKAMSVKQKDIAEAIDVDRTTYNKYENGCSEPNLETMSKLADFFGVSLDYLAGRSDDPGDKKSASTANNVVLTDLQAEAWDLVQSLNDDQLKALLVIGKTAFDL